MAFIRIRFRNYEIIAKIHFFWKLEKLLFGFRKVWIFLIYQNFPHLDFHHLVHPVYYGSQTGTDRSQKKTNFSTLWK